MNLNFGDPEGASLSRRLSSNNPFRQFEAPRNRGSSVQLSNSAFEQWIEKNKALIEDSDEEREVFVRPSFPTSSRTGSDSDVNYGRMSNNPFAAAMTGEYRHHRDPPPPPTSVRPSNTVSNKTKPPRPAKDSKPPPSYEEAAGHSAAARDYPQEKASSSSERTSERYERPERPHRYDRPQRSHSDSERHKKDHERRRRSHKSSRNKSPKKKSVEPHNSKGLDTIDKLDVSAFFGGRFHHDGPFDACTPHRNKNSKAAPVMAFPADGPNTSMKALPDGDSKDSHLYMAFGDAQDQNEIVGSIGAPGSNGSTQIGPKTNRVPDQSSMYTPRQNPSVMAFDVHAKAEPIHGPSTAGLGSTTFLDGAPAPKTDDFLNVPSSGIGRKKSLVHRLRKNSGSELTSARTSHDNSGEFQRTTFADEDAQGSSFLRRVKSLKVSRK